MIRKPIKKYNTLPFRRKLVYSQTKLAPPTIDKFFKKNITCFYMRTLNVSH